MQLEMLIKELESRPKDQNVYFDFCQIPVFGVHSWRGIYADLAIGYDDEQEPMTVATLLEKLRSAIGKTFTGWKGGEYVMDWRTPVHVDNPSRCTNTEIRFVSGNSYQTIIHTTWEGD